MTKLLKGINRDSKPVDQPQGTYRNALNSLLTKAKGAHVSEEGNELSADLGLSYGLTELGHTDIFDQRQVLFLIGNNTSIIAVYDPKNDSYNIVLEDSRLNFQEGSVIEATTRIDNDGDVIVYWTDDINPPKYLNIDNPPTSTITNIDSLNVFDFVNSVPRIDLASVNSTGGTLNTGAYFFFIAYIDEDGNKTNYLSASSPIYISDDSISSITDENDGAPPNTPTSKSITLDISQLDDNYKSAEIVVLAREGGTTKYVRSLPEIHISSQTASITYTGTESTTDTSLDNIIINKASYNTAKTLTQLDDILYLGNLTRKSDIGYQKFANNIQLQVESQTLINGEFSGGDNYKNAEIAYNYKGFKRDGVYAFYISFVLKNGSETQAYHIPGRSPLDTDETASVSDYPTELEEENIVDSANGKRFHFENRSPESSNNTGYWENINETYLDNEKWDIYDVDSNGDPQQIDTLRGENVRHHRMPSAQHIPYHTEDGNFHALGVRLTNLKIPSDIINQVKSIRVYYAERNERNKRILGQSHVHPLISTAIDGGDTGTGELYIPTISDEFTTNAYGTIPFSMIKDRTSIGEFTHINIVGYPRGIHTDVFDDGNNDYDLYDATDDSIENDGGSIQNEGNRAYGGIEVGGTGTSAGDIIIRFTTDALGGGSSDVTVSVDGTENIDDLIIKIANAISNDTFVGPLYRGDADLTNDNVIIMADVDHPGSFYNATVEIVDANGAALNAIDLTNGKDTQVNLAIDGTSKAYVPSGEEVVELQSKGFDHDGHTGYSESSIWFELVNNYIYDVNLDYTDLTSARHMGIVVDMMSHQLSLYNSFDNQVLVSTGFHQGVSNFYPPGGGSFQTNLIFGGDTYINRYGYRVSQDQSGAVGFHRKDIFYFICESYDNIDLRHEGSEYEEIYYPKSTAQQVLQLEEQDEVDDFYDNYYGYNIDYSALQNIKTTIPENEDIESQKTDFPTRIIRSQQDDPVEEIDRFREFLENDHLDLPRNRGELVTLSSADNILLPHMERGLFRTKGREELATGDVRTYIGAGDIFSVKPDEINPTEEGFAGLQDQVCAITTPHGYFFVDRTAGQVLLLGKGINVISDYGLKNFFENQLEQVESNNQLICSWDNRFERILLTLKEGTDEYPNGWTLSYYPQLKAWGSFHSYIPDYYLYDAERFYTLSDDSIYKHNIEETPSTFYGTTHPMELEFVDNQEPTLSKIFFNLQIDTDVVDPLGNDYYNETYDQFRIFTDKQDSGIQDIIPLSSLDDGSNARNIEGTWNINKFRDMLVDGSIDLNKPWYDQNRFIGKYIQVKLIFNNSDNKSLYLYDINMGVKQSIR